MCQTSAPPSRAKSVVSGLMFSGYEEERREKYKTKWKIMSHVQVRSLLRFYDGRSVRLWRCGTGGVVAGWAELYVCMYESMYV